MSGSDVTPSAMRRERPEASPEKPQYRKQRQDDDKSSRMATNLFMIVVDEGWRSWILCTGMYEWAADGLLEVLRSSGKVWER